MTALFGTAAACLGMVAWAVISWGERPAALVLAGCALYIVGPIGVTIAPVGAQTRTNPYG